MAFWSSWFKKRVTTGIVSQNKGQATWPDRDYHNFAKEAYLKNVYAFRCINEISQAVSSVPWKLFKKNKDGSKTEILEHPKLKLFQRSNPSEGVNAFINKAVAFLVLDGNSFIERLGPSTGDNAGLPTELQVIRPDRIKLLKNNDTGALIGYELNEGGLTLKQWMIDPVTMQADLLHLKNFHPIDDFMGAAPTESGAREIDTSNEATEWNKKLLENEARPGMVFTFKQQLGDVQYERFKQSLDEGYSGTKNTGKSLILEGDADAKPYGWNMNELDFIEGSREIGRRVAMAYGVPSQIIGIIGDSTYANYQTAELAFWEKTVIFYLRYLKAEFNNWIFGEDEEGLELDYNVDEIPALEPRRKEKYDLAQKSDFLTINEKRKLVGMEDHPEGDVILVQASMIPLGEEIEDETEEGFQEEEQQVAEELEEAGFDEDDVGLHLKVLE